MSCQVEDSWPMGLLRFHNAILQTYSYPSTKFCAATRTRIRVRAAAPAPAAKVTNENEKYVVEALLGVGGRGRVASTQQLQKIDQAVQLLEEDGGVECPTTSSLIEGLWRLVYTTRPGTASPIQRTFVGVDAFTVFQEINLNGVEQRVTNIVRFSDSIGELRVEAAASVGSDKRINFKFDRAAFELKFLPFKVPYPVPFRLLGDEAKGWLDTSYLSKNMRISRGNKGTTFVLQKDLDLRQTLMRAIASGNDVEKVVEELVALNPCKEPSDLEVLAGKWRLVWSSQASDANWLQRLTSGLPSWQVIKKDSGELQNLVDLFPGLRLKANAKTHASSNMRREVSIEGATVDVFGSCWSLNISSDTGFLDVLYLDNKIRISRGNKGSTFVHIREEDED